MRKKQETLVDIILIILVIMFCISIISKTFQNDTYYTIAIGEHILTEKGIDMQDPFSWHENLPYTYPHWLYDVIIYLVYYAGGLQGIYIFTCILSAILGVTLYKTNSKITGNKIMSYIITILSIYMLRGYLVARAQLVTFILFVLTIYFIEQFLQKGQKRYAVGLIIIPILIANLHLAVWPFYFILYLPYIGEYIIAKTADIVIKEKITISSLKRQLKRAKEDDEKEKIRQKIKNVEERVQRSIEKRANTENYKLEIEEKPFVKWLIVIMIICAFTGLLTPLAKDEPYTYLIKTVEGNSMQNINEHLPMIIIQQEEALYLLVAYIAILVFTKAKIKLSDLFMLGGLALLMLNSRRQLSMFVLIGAFILGKIIKELIDIYMGKDLEKISEKNKSIMTLVSLTLIFIITSVMSFNMLKDRQNEQFVDESTYPVEACTWILNNLDYENIRIFNQYNYGSYMLYRRIPVFIDSRCDLYTPEFNTPTGKVEDGKDIFMDFLQSDNIDVFYEDIFKKYDMTHCILYKNSKMNTIIKNTNTGKYTQLYDDDYFVIYEIN